MQPTITTSPFGPEATLYTLTNANGMIVKISDLGGVITEIHVPDRDGQLADVCLGFDDAAAYLGESHYLGALIGRYGNRIANGRFTLDGETYQLNVNNGVNHLHGGLDGFHRRMWEAETFATPKSAGLILSYLSADGEQGYPGNLEVTAIYELRNNNELRIAFHAITDKATPVNLTNHAYFNLAGKGDILSHELTIAADAYTPVDSGLIPTGELPTVAGTPFDFRTLHTIGARINEDDEQLPRRRLRPQLRAEQIRAGSAGAGRPRARSVFRPRAGSADPGAGPAVLQRELPARRHGRKRAHLQPSQRFLPRTAALSRLAESSRIPVDDTASGRGVHHRHELPLLRRGLIPIRVSKSNNNLLERYLNTT